MTQGITGSYAINGTDLTLQPTSGRWMSTTILGITGDGHPIYPAIRQFEVRWNINSQSDVNQIMNFFNTITITGTVSVDLPEYNSSAYQFKTYPGCVLYEPGRSEYFTEHTKEFVLTVGNIRV